MAVAGSARDIFGTKTAAVRLSSGAPSSPKAPELSSSATDQHKSASANDIEAALKLLGALATSVKGLKDNKGIQQETVFETLDLSGGRVTDADCEGIGRFVEAAGKQLRRLSLGNNKLTASGVRQLVRSLHVASSLQELWLGDNPLADAGVEVLMPCLRQLPGLRELWLSGVGMRDEGAEILAAALAADTCVCAASLKWLMLNNNAIRDKGAKALAQAMPALPGLELVSLRCNQVSNIGAAALAMAVGTAAALQLFFIQGNNLGSLGVCYIAAAVPYCRTLTELRLGGRNVGLHGAEAIAKMLPNARSLRVLGLAYADLGPNGMEKIVSAIPSSNLTHIDGVTLNEHLACLGVPATHHFSTNDAIFLALKATSAWKRAHPPGDERASTARDDGAAAAARLRATLESLAATHGDESFHETFGKGGGAASPPSTPPSAASSPAAPSLTPASAMMAAMASREVPAEVRRTSLPGATRVAAVSLHDGGDEG
jgi:Ran GTPase-activating protein (RanGAP) involved in mRNA processing and transport